MYIHSSIINYWYLGGNMKLLTFITSHEEIISPLMERLAKNGIKGASIVDCEGMLKSIESIDLGDGIIFGSLRKYLNPERTKNKMVLIATHSSDLEKCKTAIRDICGDLALPDNGIMFVLPIEYVEGYEKNK